ncbi:MAG: hypothetical protein R2791_20450 [Saprospiraceae bacterium]
MMRRLKIACFRVLMLIAGVLAADATFAQQLQPAPWNDPAVVWLAPAPAQSAVQDKLDQIEPQLANYTPGTAPHTDLLRRIVFYKSILRSLVKGSAPAQAIQDAVPDAASLGGTKEQAFTSDAEMLALCTEAVDLLSD